MMKIYCKNVLRGQAKALGVRADFCSMVEVMNHDLR